MTALEILGSVNVDAVLRVRELPRPGETVHALAFDRFLGGKGANQAVSAARSGAELRFHACIGDDEDGEWLMSQLQAHSVPVSNVEPVPGASSGRAYVCVDQHGENLIIVDAGANARLGLRGGTLEPSKVALAQLETPIPSTVEFFTKHRDLGALTVLNAAPAIIEARDALFPLTDILVLNESEMAFYAGIESLPEDVEDITTLARALISHKEQVIVLTCGAAGALAITWNGLDFTPARLTKVRDTTGSGDCFCGALCARLAEGDALDQAIRFASIAASLSVERDGAASAMPAREDTELAMFEMTAAEMPG
ncbi:MAG: ribokinase [Hyphomonas sp.]|jgi:ribokinase|uniref:ribokinase n=1 Tax=Hyphomonas sp. TaxID=87 RepID=UPI003267C303